jgi:hypothetical protein
MAVMSISLLRRVSGGGRVVLHVGVIPRSRVVPGVLVAVVGLGCSH